ncbi:hypothetical protein M011DRAFT_451135 [Sporormia fimetaria CBS 119925]|uniref:Nucleolar 27S pre-rRNA processing Urb2/Npa2 C-terminal domain-containing protein n=1 Tax=Sporormia fimetaria CBS 119925 TaxID=1340428 RepID=A0A6A6V1F9_9PLEO|nr:hypothetical protein M011DRAFT_451135 [Sporormia fimetaria CBS 119925]
MIMAATATVSQAHPAPSLSRLLAINKDLTTLDDQIDQAIRIIGLPENWETIEDDRRRSEIIQKLVRARAEWVLRWILDKLKKTEDASVHARANERAWKLLDWMIGVLPTARAATQLRDADFLSILERTLQENFTSDTTIAPAPTAKGTYGDSTSGPSEADQQDNKASRKRKRSSQDTVSSGKRAALSSDRRNGLFCGVTGVVHAISAKAGINGTSAEGIQVEHMKMVLRTETAQAARLLKGWIIAVNVLLSVFNKSASYGVGPYLDFSPMLGIWELRVIETDDAFSSSADQFSAECLIPLLTLFNRLLVDRSSPAMLKAGDSLLRTSIEDLEKLLGRHLFSPARYTFFGSANAEKKDAESSHGTADQLRSSLEPLRAKILQASQIQDSSIAIPEDFMQLFDVIPRLLDLAIKLSPSRTPKTRTAERPWIQAVFVALAECADCPLEAPRYPVPLAAIETLQKLLGVLRRHDVSIDSEVIADMFWYHTGVKYSLIEAKDIHWSLIAALVSADPDTFVTASAPSSTNAGDGRGDLTKVLFDQVSTACRNHVRCSHIDAMDIDSGARTEASPEDDFAADPERPLHETILASVVVPIMSAYARNRDLLGFIDRWYAQLSQNAEAPSRVPLSELIPNIWEDRILDVKLKELLEQSLTLTQIVGLFKIHVGAVEPDAINARSTDADSLSRAHSSMVIMRALLWSVNADDTIASLHSHLESLLDSYTNLVREESYRKDIDLTLCWITLCRILPLLWPLRLCSSSELQKKLIAPAIEQAIQDISATKKNRGDAPLCSSSKAAALLFLLTANDHLRTVPGSVEILREGVRKALKALSSSRMDRAEFDALLELVCFEFAPLLEHLEPDNRQGSLVKLLGKVAELDNSVLGAVSEGFAQSVMASPSSALRNAFAAAILQSADQAEQDESLLAVLKRASLQLRPTALSRESREAILDRGTESLLLNGRDAETILSVMKILQEVPNATSKLASHGDIFFDFAKCLHSNGHESALVLSLFQDVMQQTLTHVYSNKDQPQNEKYLEEFRSKLVAVIKKPKRCYPSRLAIVRAAFLAQKGVIFISVDQYVALLNACIAESPLSEICLAAFNEIPTNYLKEREYTLASISSIVRRSTGLQSNNQDEVFDRKMSSETKIQLHGAVARYNLCPELNTFIHISLKVLQETPEKDHLTVLRSAREALSSAASEDKFKLAYELLNLDDNRSAAYQLLKALVSTLTGKADEDNERRQEQLALLPTICDRLAKSPSDADFGGLMDIVDLVLKEKSSLLSQHNIESLITALAKLSSRYSPQLSASEAPAIYSRLCETTRLILLLHRSRLGGRFHLLLPLLQNLLFALYIPHAGRQTTLPPWLRSQTHLTPNNAAQYTRVLSTLCSPTQSSVVKAHQHRSSSKSGLNDPVKAAREYVSHYIYPLLASFCRFQLGGRLDSGVRQKLMPGIWEVIGTAELDKENLQAMFSGLDRSSREIWKGVWEEWKKMHGRGQGV